MKDVNVYLTKEGSKILKAQLKKAYRQLYLIAKNVPPGNYHWRLQRRYVDGLEFLIDASGNK